MFCRIVDRSNQHKERVKRANLAALRRQWLVTRVWDLGPRVVFEFLNEVRAHVRARESALYGKMRHLRHCVIGRDNRDAG